MFYITLRNKLRDYISRQSNCAVSDHFLVLHFHNFIKKVLFEHEITLNLATIQNTNDNASSYTNEAINTITKISIRDNYKFDTILIDEGQDFEYSWFKLVKDKFLRENGTFIIFANETQNIYERKLDEHKNCHTNIVGHWTTLNKTYRTNYNLTAFAKAYQNKFWLCHNKQLINSHFYRGVSELPYKLLFAVIYTHLEFRYEMSHTITS
ncbi:hypothetical protein, partial [Campylobacter sp.]|uniref:hypothetical protein n=1 Tax=Campylobacter sp. TaxID=205 RepID=UPI002A39EE49